MNAAILVAIFLAACALLGWFFERFEQLEPECPACKGRGVIGLGDWCGECNGRGVVKDRRD